MRPASGPARPSALSWWRTRKNSELAALRERDGRDPQALVQAQAQRRGGRAQPQAHRVSRPGARSGRARSARAGRGPARPPPAPRPRCSGCRGPAAGRGRSGGGAARSKRLMPSGSPLAERVGERPRGGCGSDTRASPRRRAAATRASAGGWRRARRRCVDLLARRTRWAAPQALRRLPGRASRRTGASTRWRSAGWMRTKAARTRSTSSRPPAELAELLALGGRPRAQAHGRPRRRRPAPWGPARPAW